MKVVHVLDEVMLSAKRTMRPLQSLLPKNSVRILAEHMTPSNAMQINTFVINDIIRALKQKWGMNIKERVSITADVQL